MSAITLSKPTARDHELLGMPTLVSQFPVQFANGAAWESLECYCSTCKHTLPQVHVRGTIVRWGDHMAAIEAAGACRVCRVITRFTFRLYDDMRLTAPLKKGGWGTWGGSRAPWSRRVLMALARLWRNHGDL